MSSTKALGCSARTRAHVDLNLKAVDGPGHVFLYSVDAFGSPTVFFNSATGISDADLFPVRAGTDSHQNWAFSEPGIYRITVEAWGILQEDGCSISSEEAVLTFDVLAPPVPLSTVLRIDRQDANTVIVSWDSIAGVVYQLQSLPNLQLGAWMDEGAAQTGTGGPIVLEAPLPTIGANFFRLRIIPD